jgi:hypothetical protein
MSKILYFVLSGPDISHLIEVNVFNKLYKAKAHIKTLPVTPMGMPRPFILQRAEYNKSTDYNNNSVNIKQIKI